MSDDNGAMRKIIKTRGIGNIGVGIILNKAVREGKANVFKEKERSNNVWERIG